MKLSLVPRERRFFGLFGRLGSLLATTLEELNLSLGEGRSRHERLRDLEHECDELAHEIYNLTNRTFSPPIAPEHIMNLTRSLDTVVDLAEEVSDKIDLYKATPVPDAAKRLGECLAAAGKQLASVVAELEQARAQDARLQEVHRLENEGDRITRDALRTLFTSAPRQPTDLVKWKDIIGLLEATLDECESAAEIVETIAIKNA